MKNTKKSWRSEEVKKCDKLFAASDKNELILQQRRMRLPTLVKGKWEIGNCPYNTKSTKRLARLKLVSDKRSTDLEVQ